MEIKEERGLGPVGGGDSGKGPAASGDVCGARSGRGDGLGREKGLDAMKVGGSGGRGKERDREENHEPDLSRLVGTTRFSLS
ncbi:hypothetical protein MA16_Dca020946 [Dendrobium catenatum]|uniref:Uncharacterized protein n=1 Tax=Dendrobium catenatum TaxID=906689 RepID=A0A2I0XFV8_9ASPA|nr:hypothetical protein MA16_Dca020946 [Dendrobium catenatum]